MSHQTGIQANDELKQYFAKSREGKIRVLKVVIKNEQLSLGKQCPVKGTWEQDYDKYVSGIIEDDMPCYILYRLDSKNSLGHEWVFLSWTPDSAAVRHKMLYASTKATLKTEFGSAHIADDFHATTKEEATLAGYKSHLRGVAAPAPLTQREEALKEVELTSHSTDFSPSSRQSTLGGVSFPLTESAKSALIDMQKGTYNYLQFKIDIDEEKITLSKAGLVELSCLPQHVPSDEARYHLYIFSHSHEGDYLDSLVFVYSMPGYSCSIKERMLYSSCKGQFLEYIQHSGLDVVKKLEIDDGKELTETYLYEEIHPTRNLHRPAFAKPQGPPNRGAKRITRPQETQ